MSKKACPFLYRDLTVNIGQDFLDIKESLEYYFKALEHSYKVIIHSMSKKACPFIYRELTVNIGQNKRLYSSAFVINYHFS